MALPARLTGIGCTGGMNGCLLLQTYSTFSAFKTNMENTIQNIFETHQPVVVKKNRRSSVVVMPLEDYQALTETKYLLNSPANAARLVRGIEEIENLIALSSC